MPVIKSAKKRVRQSRKAAVRNARTRRSMREALKTLQAALDGGDVKKLAPAQKAAQSALDQAVKKGLMHKNKAARKKKQLAGRVKATGVKVPKTSPAQTSKEVSVGKPKTATKKSPVTPKKTAKKSTSQAK
ncbi:MAG TPA: 30S ribosomal protein S20 [Candidatus Saccharimonadales bacterium]|nr:30S ribosomal protein S20 [Candidatus Saccharimonadales bacterium]